MTIAVTTPHGNVGQHVVRSLVRAGVRPLLLTRSRARVPQDLAPYVDVAEADSFDAETVIDATRGVETIYWVDPPAPSPSPLDDYARATDALSAAITANEIERVVFQSSVGAEKRHGVGDIDGLAITETALDALGVSVTHLRCGYFCTNLLFDIESVKAGNLRTLLPLDMPVPWAAPRDIAEVAALTLLNRDWSGRRVQAVHGAQDLSWRHVAQILSEELGHRVTAERIDDEVMRQQLRSLEMPEAAIEAVVGMSIGIRDDFTPEQQRTPATTTPTTLRAWVRTELIPVLNGESSRGHVLR